MSIWRGDHPLILASQSAVRKSLLENAGLTVETMPANIDERGIQQKSGMKNPGGIATLLAAEKAKHVSALHPKRYVVGADQTLALGERLFSKPAGRDAAADQLAALAGQMHTLHSAVSVARQGQVVFSHVGAARMTMRKLTARDIASYLDAAGDKVTTSVGAYQLEGLGAHLLEKVDGDHFTILGLPLLPLLAFLRGENLLSV
ncbi:MAG: Maf family protein [Afipia sp.]|nr:Maf family protein [Afipia sp.]